METFGETKAAGLKQFLELPFGIPSPDTFGHVLSIIAPAECERCWLKGVNTQVKLPSGEIVALDGKTVRGSHDRSHGQAALEVVSAWSSHPRLTLGQLKVAADSKEITAVPELLKLLALAGCLVTRAALNTQKNLPCTGNIKTSISDC